MKDKNIKIKFTDIVGYEMEKESLKEKVILPILYPILFQGKRAPQTNTILYGPSGTGKSYLSKAVLNEMVDKNKFFSLSFDKIINKTIEQRISLIKELFESASKQKPSIIFIEKYMDDIIYEKKTYDYDDSDGNVGNVVYRLPNNILLSILKTEETMDNNFIGFNIFYNRELLISDICDIELLHTHIKNIEEKLKEDGRTEQDIQ